MTFDELWPHLLIPGEFDSMDECDQERWRGVLRQAWQAGVDETARRCAELCRAAVTNSGFAAEAEADIHSTFHEAFK